MKADVSGTKISLKGDIEFCVNMRCTLCKVSAGGAINVVLISLFVGV